nr:MAG TPA: hypothetical protein [Caudoviricetes sp.]
MAKKRLTKNQLQYANLIDEATKQHISVKGINAFPKRITQQTLLDLQEEIEQRKQAQSHTITDEIISRLQSLPTKKITYDRSNGTQTIVTLLEFTNKCLSIIKNMQQTFGIQEYEEYLQKNAENIIDSLDTIIQTHYSGEVSSETAHIIPILSNHDMSMETASMASDINDYFNWSDLDNI